MAKIDPAAKRADLGRPYEFLRALDLLSSFTCHSDTFYLEREGPNGHIEVYLVRWRGGGTGGNSVALTYISIN